MRKNIDGELFLTVYGKPITVSVDPIEKKPLFHFQPGSKILSFGTVGCNFACDFCQNWDISQSPKFSDTNGDKLEPSEYGYDISPEEFVDICKEKKLDMIAATYNEPTVFFEYAYDIAKRANEEQIQNVWVTNGYATKETIDKIAPYLDAANIDIKSFSNKFYKEISKASIEPVLENIKYLFQKGIWIELTTLIIPGENDSEKELRQIAEFISSISQDIPWHISAFHPAYKMKDKERTKPEKIHQAYEIGKEAGLNFIYGGNVMDKDLQNTYCPNCETVLIRRDWKSTEIVNLDDGKCKECNQEIPGIWK